jgi:pimeloyl-ACP methyl ester carboxylesterase
VPTTPINGSRIYWELTGNSGDGVVLVHGSWGDHSNWARVAPALSQSFRVLVYDRRGHSQSERSERPGNVREDVADLAALIQHVQLAPAHIIGSSFGASIVLRLAGEHPDLFRTMVVHEPPLFDLLAGEPTTAAELEGVQRRIEHIAAILSSGDHAGGAREFVETIAAGPGSWDVMPLSARETFIFNAPTWLDEVRDPQALELDLASLTGFAARALLTTGDQSPQHFPLVVRRIASVMGHARTHTYRGAGHVPHLTHAKDYVRVVTGFIRNTAA